MATKTTNMPALNIKQININKLTMLFKVIYQVNIQIILASWLNSHDVMFEKYIKKNMFFILPGGEQQATAAVTGDAHSVKHWTPELL